MSVLRRLKLLSDVLNLLSQSSYRVDRQKSIDVLKSFLDKKETLLDRECRWLLSVKADSVLSDAAFLGW